MEIHQKLANVMGEILPIAKNTINETDGYFFRSVDDVINELSKHFRSQKIFVVPEVLNRTNESRKDIQGNPLNYCVLNMQYTFVASDGSSITASGVGEGFDTGDKATNKARTSAYKYVLTEMFLIPTSEKKDVEIDSPQVQAKPATQTVQPSQEVQQPVNKGFDRDLRFMVYAFGKDAKKEAEDIGFRIVNITVQEAIKCGFEKCLDQYNKREGKVAVAMAKDAAFVEIVKGQKRFKISSLYESK